MGQSLLGTINNKQFHGIDIPKNPNKSNLTQLHPPYTVEYIVDIVGGDNRYFCQTKLSPVLYIYIYIISTSSQGSAPAAPWRSERNFCDNSESKSASNDCKGELWQIDDEETQLVLGCWMFFFWGGGRDKGSITWIVDSQRGDDDILLSWH